MMFIVRTVRNTQIHSVGTKQSFGYVRAGDVYNNYWALKG
jgi:hypothetical protein